MRALISVYDKRGLAEFARGLEEQGYELLSTGGSARHLADAGLSVISVEEVTGFPEILDGRVKTLHPSIHGALLARRDLPDHMATLDSHGIAPIDIVVSNLYPFEQSVHDPDLDDQGKIEQIDIGGPAMVRAAAKNFASVAIVTDPADYDEVLAAIRDGQLDQAARRRLAAKAFAHVAAYDALVSAFLRQGDSLFPEELSIGLRKRRSLRYGENPQQEAAAYEIMSIDPAAAGLLDARQLHGKDLSFNNLLDGDAAVAAARISAGPTVSIIKHTVPCGLATRPSLDQAFAAALAGDPVSAFGGIVALNREVDAATAAAMSPVFFEVVIAPSYAPEALAMLTRKKNLRLLELPSLAGTAGIGTRLDIRPIRGGALLQTVDEEPADPSSWQVVTRVAPTDAQRRDLAFAWEAVRLVKSNAIVFVRDEAIVGVGAGQPNRVESVNLAARKAGETAQGAALASDAFFPFADNIHLAAQAGITSIVQPGGSVRDQEVIAAADDAGIAMVFTGTRHFRH